MTWIRPKDQMPDSGEPVLIELPSDEEINEVGKGHCTFLPSFVYGAQWMRDKIQEQLNTNQMTWTKLTPHTMPIPMEEVFLALADGNYAVGWLTKSPTPTFVNIHNEAWWVSEVSAWMYPKKP
jgi:hypothetical protein